VSAPEVHSTGSYTFSITPHINVFEKWDEFYNWLGDNEINNAAKKVGDAIKNK